MKGIAFYDFDNTIIHGDVGPLFGEYILSDRYETIKARDGRRAADRDRRALWTRYLPYVTALSLQAGLYKLRAVRRSSLVRQAYKALKGIPADEYYGLMQEFVDQEIPDRLYPEMVQSIKDHLSAGRKVVIITTGIEKLVERCLAHLPNDIHVIGCRLHERDGKFTGKVDGPLYGADKANILLAFCEAAGVDPAACYAYSDHYSDYHMLQAVGEAVCVNPRGRLLKMANAEGWTVATPVSPGEAPGPSS